MASSTLINAPLSPKRQLSYVPARALQLHPALSSVFALRQPCRARPARQFAEAPETSNSPSTSGGRKPPSGKRPGRPPGPRSRPKVGNTLDAEVVRIEQHGGFITVDLQHSTGRRLVYVETIFQGSGSLLIKDFQDWLAATVRPGTPAQLTVTGQARGGATVFADLTSPDGSTLFEHPGHFTFKRVRGPRFLYNDAGVAPQGKVLLPGPGNEEPALSLLQADLASDMQAACSAAVQKALRCAEKAGGSLQALDERVTAAAQARVPTQADRELRERCLKVINEFVIGCVSQLPGGDSYTVVLEEGCTFAQPHGSFVSNLYETTRSDFDLGIEGHQQRTSGVKVKLEHLSRTSKQSLLQGVWEILQERVPRESNPRFTGTARVPFIRMRGTESGLQVDITVSGIESRFKNRVLAVLVQKEPRFAQLTRLVKAWARTWSINSAFHGTLSSWALTNMVIFFLQQCSPPVLPPLHELFQTAKGSAADRPLQDGEVDEEHLASCLSVCEKKVEHWSPESNTQSAAELLVSFCAFWAGAFSAWQTNRFASHVRVSTWAGEWQVTDLARAEGYRGPVCVEEPFDDTLNTTNNIHQLEKLKDCFERAHKTLAAAKDDAGAYKALTMFLYKLDVDELSY